MNSISTTTDFCVEYAGVELVTLSGILKASILRDLPVANGMGPYDFSDIGKGLSVNNVDDGIIVNGEIWEDGEEYLHRLLQSLRTLRDRLSADDTHTAEDRRLTYAQISDAINDFYIGFLGRDFPVNGF